MGPYLNTTLEPSSAATTPVAPNIRVYDMTITDLSTDLNSSSRADISRNISFYVSCYSFNNSILIICQVKKSF